MKNRLFKEENQIGTNYYFEIKNHDEFTKKLFDLIIKETKFFTAKVIKELIPKQIHICKFSHGYSPLFEGTIYYRTMNELIHFYESNKDILRVIDEYNIEIDFNNLIFQCKKRRDNVKNKRDDVVCYRLCDDDFEWLDSDFC